jgi:Flp pilus assembly protein TadB
MGDRFRWFLLTHEGRRALAWLYVVAATVTVVVYWFWRSPLYGIGQAVMLGFGLFWIRWCIRRPRPEGLQRG